MALVLELGPVEEETPPDRNKPTVDGVGVADPAVDGDKLPLDAAELAPEGEVVAVVAAGDDTRFGAAEYTPPRPSRCSAPSLFHLLAAVAYPSCSPPPP